MARHYQREEVRSRLERQVRENRMILAFGAGIGLTAKCAELGGADLVCVYSTARARMKGKSSLWAWLPYENANAVMLEMAEEILPVVKETPCVAGVGAHDPSLDLDRFLQDLKQMGFSGVTNEPFVGMYGPDFGALLEQAGLGFSREVELIAAARAQDLFTLAWAFDPEEARAMARAGADSIGAMVGLTAGGLTGAGATDPLEAATAQVDAICQAAREINPDVMVLTHGGPFKDVESARHSVRNSPAVGYVAGSSGERVPTEQAVTELVEEYKGIAQDDRRD